MRSFNWINPASVGFAVLSYVFFYDTLGLGYTTAHSLWHFSTAACALSSVVEPPAPLARYEAFRVPLRGKLAARLGRRA